MGPPLTVQKHANDANLRLDQGVTPPSPAADHSYPKYARTWVQKMDGQFKVIEQKLPQDGSKVISPMI